MESIGTATYSPEDNKLRLYPLNRLDTETYARVKAAGFSWAPRQELFVAPMWTPSREDLLVELCGDLGDEDTSLTERAEVRADRFEDYSDKREADAESAHRAVRQIADGIPFGQPILVGHHSEKRARKDAERIESGMRRAVNMWKTSEYWQSRARGAILHAKYLERPDVRARRIKTIEADKRKAERATSEAKVALVMWGKLHDPAAFKKKDGSESTLMERAMFITNRCSISQCFTLAKYPRAPEIRQYEGELSLWSALDYGIINAEQAAAIAIPVYERNNAHRARWIEHYDNRIAYERAMLADVGGTVADKTKPEKGGACKCWASPGYGKGWSYIQKVNQVSVTVLENYGNGGRTFRRTMPFDKLTAIMTAAEVEAARAADLVRDIDGIGFYLQAAPAETRDEAKDRVHAEHIAAKPDTTTRDARAAMEAALKQGVQVVTAPQLFVTPRDLGARMVEIADIAPGHRVLEPSAGTGEILRLIGNAPDKVAVEINSDLVSGLMRLGLSGLHIHQGDFLQCNGDLGTFDRILMNPPFVGGADIAHITHAQHMLKPGGRLVAICANGPRQNQKLRPLCSEWHDLPAGTFAAVGTNVNTALIVIESDRLI